MSSLTGRTALITGATTGIGRAVALHLAAHGAAVVAHGRDARRGAALVAEITGRGGSARFLAADLSDAAEVTRLAAGAGDIDILVNNAGISEFASTAGTGGEGFDRHFAINTRAPFLLVAALAPAMAARGHGAVVNISSIGAHQVAPIGAVYGASKAALENLTRNWATEFGAHGVRVNAISLGPVLTDRTEQIFGDGVGRFHAVNLRGRAASPAEVAELVLFLAEERSSYLNGSVLVAHGGERSMLPS